MFGFRVVLVEQSHPECHLSNNITSKDINKIFDIYIISSLFKDGGKQQHHFLLSGVLPLVQTFGSQEALNVDLS